MLVRRSRLWNGFNKLVFVGVMLGSAGLSLIRILLVASALPKADFGSYAAIAAAGAFLGGIVSFGIVEGTHKYFPRLAAQGQVAAMRSHAYLLLRRLSFRSLGPGIPLLTLGWLVDNSLLVYAGTVAVLAFAISYSSLVASMQRAIDDPRRLAGGSTFRAVLTLVCVVPTAYFAGLRWALLVEALAIIAGSVLSERILLRSDPGTRSDNNVEPTSQSMESPAIGDGIRLFLTYTAVSVPFYLDRLYVTAVMGSDAAAEYALLALLLTAATLLVNAIAGRAGPMAIRRVTAQNGSRSAFRYVSLWGGIGLAIWLLVIGSVALLLAQGWLPASLAKYDLDTRFLLPIAVLGALQASALLEFLLLAFDKERRMLMLALIYLGAVLAVSGFVAAVGADLFTLIWLLAGARLLYCGTLILSLRSLTHSDSWSSHA